MSTSHAPFPLPDEGLRLHLRLCADDPVAPSDLCRAYVAPLCACLGRHYRGADADLVQSAVHDAVLRYLQRPQVYDPGRADLATYLRVLARGALFKLFRREKRHQQGRLPWPVVELGQEQGNISGRDDDPSRELERAELTARWQALLAAVREGLTPEEGRVLDLMLAGERDTRRFAAALGLEGLPAAEQARAVKRVKDRIGKRLERGGRNHG